jgi:hypothetical protein
MRVERNFMTLLSSTMSARLSKMTDEGPPPPRADQVQKMMRQAGRDNQCILTAALRILHIRK